MEKIFLPGDPPLAFVTREGGRRLDAALAEVLPGSGLRARRRLWQWCRVLVNGRERSPAWKVTAGDCVRVEELTHASELHTDAAGTLSADASTDDGAEPLAEHIRLVEAGRDFAALYKPAGMHSAFLSGGGGTSLEGLLPVLWPCLWREYISAPVCHCPRLLTRLDYGTSGLALAAFSEEAEQRFRVWEAEGAVEKRYFAVVRGDLRESLYLRRALNTAERKKTRVLEREDADPARHTQVIPLGPAEEFHNLNGEAADMRGGDVARTLVLAIIRRGARHQIRAHLSAAGFPLYGDPLYGDALPDISLPGGAPFLLHHAAVRLPGFSATVMPDWGIGEASACPCIPVSPMA